MATPFAWTSPNEVNRHVAELAAWLTARGHRVTVIAPSADRAAVRRARERVREVLMDERDTLFDPPEPYPRYFFPGGTYPLRLNRRLSVIAAPADLISNIDVLLQSEQLDVLHVHEPFVPSVGWMALRYAGCPLVATFHTDSERYRAYWLARPRLQRYFEAFDSVLAVSRAVRDSAARAFEGEFRIIPGGVDVAAFQAADRRGDGPLRLLFDGSAHRRDGLRTLLRALRRLDDEAPLFELDVLGDELHELRYGTLVPDAFADRVHFHGRLGREQLAGLYAGADVLCAPALEAETFAVTLLQGMTSGLAIVASDIAGYRELIVDGREGVLVPPHQPRALARELRALAHDGQRRQTLAAAGLQTARRYSWETVGAELEAVYGQVVRRRRRRSAAPRRLVELYADFHVHSEHSKDCMVRVPDILERARTLGIDIIAITDHNSLDGGLQGLALADQYGVRVIAGEEVKTAEGEVIGLFLAQSIPAGLSFAETLAAIKRQGGVVYVPHPFDRLHTVPSYTLLREHVADIDVMEVFNARLAFPSFNERAELFAQRYRIPAAAGSDAHVLPGLGTALTGMADFRGPEDFAAALADSRIVRRRKSVLYLTSLKFMQTTITGQVPQR
jgi:hypothetical protein